MASDYTLFNSEFNPNIFDRADFKYMFEPSVGRRFLLDTSVVLWAIQYDSFYTRHKKNNLKKVSKYSLRINTLPYKRVQEKFPAYDVRRFIKTMPIVVPFPTMAEIYYTKMGEMYRRRTWELLNRENVTLLADSRLTFSRWEDFLGPHDPLFMQNLKKQLYNGIGGIGRNDEILIALSHFSNHTLMTFDETMIEVAFKLDVPVFDARVENSLPLEPPQMKNLDGDFQNHEEKVSVNEGES